MRKFKWTVDVNDGFCTWRYDFVSEGRNCINDVKIAIENSTGLKCSGGKLLRRPLKSKVVAKTTHNKPHAGSFGKGIK